MFLFGLAAFLFTALAAALLLYISIATGLGPWVAPLLIVMIRSIIRDREQVALLAIIASFGGAIATGIGFSVTTLYFVDRPLWEYYCHKPWLVVGGIGIVVLVAGWWGLVLARRYAPRLVNDGTIPFPVATSIVTTLAIQSGLREQILFLSGIFGAILVGGMRLLGGVWAVPWVMPVGWATGFLAGADIIIPLLVGMGAQYLVVAPLATWAEHCPWEYFSVLRPVDITFALCSGLLLSGLGVSLVKNSSAFRYRSLRAWARQSMAFSVNKVDMVSMAAVGGMLCAVGISVPVSVGIVAGLYLVLDHLVHFASRTGLATYGRYMTILMLPLLALPSMSSAHIVFVCLIVGVAGAAIVDGVCTYKVGALCNMNENSVYRAQILGLVCTALSVGGLLWLLCAYGTVGTWPLVAHRGLSRALLMQSFSFNGVVVALGVVLGLLLGRYRINSVMVFGGLVMPHGLTFALVLGASIRKIAYHDALGTIVWSGVLVGDIVWLLINFLAAIFF